MIDIDKIIAACRKDSRTVSGSQRRALCDEIERLRNDCECYEAMKEGVLRRIADLEAERDQFAAWHEEATTELRKQEEENDQFRRDHEAMELLRTGVVYLAKHAACESQGRFCAWGKTCHYADDPAEAILAAADEEGETKAEEGETKSSGCGGRCTKRRSG